MDQLPRLGKRELICLLLFTFNYMVSVWRGFLCLRVLGVGYVILLWHSLSLPYNYFICLNIMYRSTLIQKINPIRNSSLWATKQGYFRDCGCFERPKMTKNRGGSDCGILFSYVALSSSCCVHYIYYRGHCTFK